MDFDGEGLQRIVGQRAWKDAVTIIIAVPRLIVNVKGVAAAYLACNWACFETWVMLTVLASMVLPVLV
jgi:hypothetical protein